ncbi:MAG: PAS domain-containing protein, partial [Angustibacter sp.]
LRRLRAVGELDPDSSGRLTPRPALAALALLDTTLVSLILCRPILDADGQLVDLTIVHATPATRDPVGRGAADLVGRRFLELFPHATTDGLMAQCREVIARGREVDLLEHPWQVAVRTARHTYICHIRISRYRDGVLVTWQDADSPGHPRNSRSTR